ncbi:MAG: amino acid permease [Acidobacteriota bacterium]
MSSGTVQASTARPTSFVRDLSTFDATMIVVGSMIGSGIFMVSPEVARTVGAPGWMVMAWVLGGFLTVVGAISVGELASMYPHAGGQYVYLREAYGKLSGFLYGWTLFLVIQAGTIAAVAVAFSKFLGVLVPWVSAESRIIPVFLGSRDLSFTTQRLVAILSIAVLTWINLRGVHSAKIVQNLFTVTKIGGLAALVAIPLLAGHTSEAVAVNFTSGDFWGREPFEVALLSLLGVALVGPLFSSDAWNNITFAGEEVKKPERTLPRALLFGTVLVTGLYVLTNISYLSVLPLWGSESGATVLERGIQYAAEDRVGVAAVETLFGGTGALFMAAALMISTFGCNNGLILSGPRLYFAMARDRLFFRGLATLNRKAVPAGGLIAQGIWASLLTLSGTYSDLLEYLIFGALIFYVMTIAGIFVLRRTRPEHPRPTRAPLYPWLQIVYVALATAVIVNLLVMKPVNAGWGLLIILTGLPVYFFWQHRAAANSSAQ